MKKKIIWWAIKDKKGNIIPYTIKWWKKDAADAFDLEDINICSNWGWSETARYKRIEKAGYKFCKVEIKEIK